MKIKNIYLGSLTSLAVIASSAVSANQGVYVPELQGGVTATVGAWIATPSSAESTTFISRSGTYDEALNVTPGYDVGIEASLGYIFEDTANGIEFFFRNFDTNDTTDFVALNPISPLNEIVISENLGYELTSFDLMINQFMNIGQHMQMRFGAGASYVGLEQQNSITAYGETENENAFVQENSEYKGWGPRLAIDARYDFGNHIEGLGIVAGGSVAYFLGDLDNETPQARNQQNDFKTVANNLDNQAVTNLRGNVGIDYVYFFSNDEKSTLGLELGYQVDYYADAIASTQTSNNSADTNTSSATFSGPYVQLKGAF